ncbi:MAG: bacterioferritin [Lentimicrobium sp.]|nr:bacterioferritin [Lentimicrobium sp.]
MSGKADLIMVMNSLLEESLAAQNQNMVHAEICLSWGYKKLQMAFRMQIIDQMRRSEWLIERIIFLGGTPLITKFNTIIKLGKTVAEMIGNEKSEEKATLKAYNIAINLARKVKDQGSVEMLTRILKLQENQTAWVESQQVQIEQMGLENYLSNQTLDAVN